MFCLKKNKLKDIGPGDIVYFTDGTIAKVEFVDSVLEEPYVHIMFGTMIPNNVECVTSWDNRIWFDGCTGKRAFCWFDGFRLDTSCDNHIVKVDRIGEDLSNKTAEELFKAKYGTSVSSTCVAPLIIGKQNGLTKLQVDDTVQFRDGQIACVKAIEETEYQNYPYKIIFNRILSFDNGKLTINGAGYCENGCYGAFYKSSADIIAIIPSGLAERAAKVKKEYEQRQKQKEVEKKMKIKTISLDELKVGDRISFRDGQTVTAVKVKRVDSDLISITFNKKVRMKEPSGVMMVNFEIFRLDGTVTLEDWKNKDIVAVIPPERKEMDANESSSHNVFTERQLCEDKGTPVDLSKLHVGDIAYIRGGFRCIVSRIARAQDVVYIEYAQHVRPKNSRFATNSEWYSYTGKCIGRTANSELDIISIAKVETVDKPYVSSDVLEGLIKEVAELKKQIAILVAQKGNGKTTEDKNDGNMLFVNKSKPKKKGKSDAN